MPRVRFSTRMPLIGNRIGLTVWFGSVQRGWYGKPVAPWRWFYTYRVNGVAG